MAVERFGLQRSPSGQLYLACLDRTDSVDVRTAAMAGKRTTIDTMKMNFHDPSSWRDGNADGDGRYSQGARVAPRRAGTRKVFSAASPPRVHSNLPVRTPGLSVPRFPSGSDHSTCARSCSASMPVSAPMLLSCS